MWPIRLRFPSALTERASCAPHMILFHLNFFILPSVNYRIPWIFHLFFPSWLSRKTLPTPTTGVNGRKHRGPEIRIFYEVQSFKSLCWLSNITKYAFIICWNQNIWPFYSELVHVKLYACKNLNSLILDQILYRLNLRLKTYNQTYFETEFTNTKNLTNFSLSI